MRSRGRSVLTTFGKELRETLRDRRTLAVMILFPLVVYPLLALLGGEVAATRMRAKEDEPVRVAVVGIGAVAEDLRRRAREAPKRFTLVETATTADVEAGRLDLLARVQVNHVEVIFDATRDESREAEDRVSEMSDQAITAACPPPLIVKRTNLGKGQKLGSYVLSKALPLMIVVMVLLGSFYPAIDVTAGERERGTLETLLTAPVRRADLLLGKVLAVMVLASLTGAFNLISMSLTVSHGLNLMGETVKVVVPWSRALATGLVILPTAFMLASLFVTLGSLARGFKDAQNLLVPVHFILFAPAMLATLGDFALTRTAALIPGVNVTLLARELALGRAQLVPALLVLGSTILVGVLILRVAARLYDSESILEAAGSLGGILRVAARPGGPVTAPESAPPTAGEAMGLYAVAYLLLLFVFVPMQKRDLVSGLLASQYLGLLGLVVVYARLTRRRLADVLVWRRPSGRALGGAVLLGASAWVIVGLLAEWLLPVPKEVIEALRKALITESKLSLGATVMLVALTPAFCEEALFRGPVLRGLLTRVGPVAAFLLTGILFGLLHMSVWRLIPTTLLGVMLSFIAWRAGSILPAMVAHALNNGILVVLARLGLDRHFESASWTLKIAGAGGAFVVAGAGLWLLHGGRRVGSKTVG